MKKILLLDGKKKHAELIQEVLKKNNFEVLCASNLSEAWSQMSQSPDLLLLNIPIEEDLAAGLKFARELEKEGSIIPIIFQAERSEEGTRRYAAEIKMAKDYFVKPYNLSELVYRMIEILA